MNLYYKIDHTVGVFFSLNNRAIEHLQLFGNWIDLQDRGIMEQCNYGVLYVGPSESELVSIGVIIDNKVLPAIPYVKHNNKPLYKYKMVNYDLENSEWVYEVIDKKRSKSPLYSSIDLKCLSYDKETRMYEWTTEEIELAEVILEYNIDNLNKLKG